MIFFWPSLFSWIVLVLIWTIPIWIEPKSTRYMTLFWSSLFTWIALVLIWTSKNKRYMTLFWPSLFTWIALALIWTSEYFAYLSTVHRLKKVCLACVCPKPMRLHWQRLEKKSILHCNFGDVQYVGRVSGIV